MPPASHHDAGFSGHDASTVIEPRDAPVLPKCLQGDAPDGCAALPAPPILTDWVCPAGWVEVPGFADAAGDELVPDGVAPFSACAPPARVTCPEGQLQRTGDVACHAVGDACPAGAFPEGLPAANVLYVLAGASGGDGTEASPFGTLAEAYAAASDGATIAIGKGTYLEALTIDRAVTLWGACAAEVVMDAPAPTVPEDATHPSTLVGAIDVRDGGDVTARNLTVTGARVGLRVYGAGTLKATGVRVASATRTGVRIDQGSAELEDVLIQDTQPAPDKTDGDGLRASSGASVTARGVVLVANRFLGIGAVSSGTTVTLDDVVVSGTEARLLDRTFGRGIEIDDGAKVVAQRVILEGNRDMALACAGGASSATTELELSDAVVRDTRPREKGNAFGNGAAFISRASARLQRVAFARNRDVAVIAIPGTGVSPSVKLEDVIIRDTLSRLNDARFGRGLLANDGANVEVDRAVIERNADAAVMADTVSGESPATIIMRDVVVRDTRSVEADPEDLVGGWGLVAQNESSVTVERGLFERSRDFGIFGNTQAGALSPTLGLTDITVRDTRSRESDGENGNGLLAADGAKVTLLRASFDGNREVGLMVYNQAGARRSVLDASDLTIIGTLSDEQDGTAGVGLAAVNGADVTVERALIEGNRSAGILAYRSGEAEGPVLSVSEALVRGTLPQQSDDSLGMGIAVREGASCTVTRSVIEGNHEFGFFIDHAEGEQASSLTATDVVIRDTQESAKELRYGWGMGIQGRSEVTVLRALIEGSAELGIAAFEPGALVTLSHVAVRGTKRARCGAVPFGEPASCVLDGAAWGTYYGGGIALGAYEGARIDLDHVELSGSPLCGIQLSRGGLASVRHGEIHGNVIGLNVQVEAFDYALLMNDTVRWYDNESTLDTKSLPVPSPSNAIPDLE